MGRDAGTAPDRRGDLVESCQDPVHDLAKRILGEQDREEVEIMAVDPLDLGGIGLFIDPSGNLQGSPLFPAALPLRDVRDPDRIDIDIVHQRLPLLPELADDQFEILCPRIGRGQQGGLGDLPFILIHPVDVQLLADIDKVGMIDMVPAGGDILVPEYPGHSRPAKPVPPGVYHPGEVPLERLVTPGDLCMQPGRQAAAQVPDLAEPDEEHGGGKESEDEADVPWRRIYPEHDIHEQDEGDHRTDTQDRGVRQPLDKPHIGKTGKEDQREDKTRDEEQVEKTQGYP